MATFRFWIRFFFSFTLFSNRPAPSSGDPAQWQEKKKEEVYRMLQKVFEAGWSLLLREASWHRMQAMHEGVLLKMLQWSSSVNI